MQSLKLGLILSLLVFIAACSTLSPTPSASLKIVSGSENQTLQPIVDRFAKENNVKIDMDYKGSLDIALLLQEGAQDYDAIWPANSLWISMGDKNHLVKDSESIMRSPVILGVKCSVADKLGWRGKDVKVQDILDAAENKGLRLLMTSATQSNSGASAYLGFLYAFSGNPDLLTADNLNDPKVQDNVKRILKVVNRSSESSGWLRDLFLKDYDLYDAMFNYESLVIEMNQQLVKSGREPLCAVYPVDGLAIADSPLAFVNKGDAKKEELFKKLQDYMLSQPVQNEILSKGRRVGLVGMTPDKVDKTVFNPDWGIDVTKVLNPIRVPGPTVIQQALDLYQTALRKPSFTIYALDFSGSMGENGGEQQLKQAMKLLLDQQEASKYLLQAAPDDVNIVLTFNDGLINGTEIDQWTAKGNKPADLNALLGRVQELKPGGNTNIYLPVARALELMKAQGIEDRFPAIILMTDGQSNRGSLDQVKQAIAQTGLTNVPVYAITFGEADVSQLKQLTDLTHGLVYDGTKDLITAFRKARSNN